MASRRSRYLKPALVLLVGAVLAYGLLVGKPGPEPKPPAVAVAPVVQVVTATPADLALTVATQGSVTPRREVNIVSQVAGIVQQVDAQFAVGGFFDEGTVLVKVEDSDYQFARVRADARMADAAQLVALEKGRVRQAAREWRDLGNEEANQLFLRKPQLAAAEASLEAARADLGQSELDLERTAITVPFAGRILEKYVDQGQYLTPGTPIARVYATDVVEVRLPLTDRQVALLDLPLSYQETGAVEQRRAPVELSARFADREWQWQGQIVRTDASIDVDSRVVYAVVEVANPFARVPGSDRPPLSIGLFVNAEIRGRTLAQVATLPRNALRNDGSVLLVDADDRIEPRQVRVLKSDLREAWVQGLERGDRVVVSSLPMAIAGMSVTVREPAGLALGVEPAQ
jgi:RND family efflux transporter MFP subunit